MKLSGGLVIICLLFALAGCGWLRSMGQDTEVRVTTAAAVEDCAAAGSTRVSVFEPGGDPPRSDAQIAAELATLARRSALQLGGNAVVPVSDIVDGSRTFAVYRCRH